VGRLEGASQVCEGFAIRIEQRRHVARRNVATSPHGFGEQSIVVVDLADFHRSKQVCASVFWCCDVLMGHGKVGIIRTAGGIAAG
jgi:hypothetical protein